MARTDSKTLVVATHNLDKLEEIKAILFDVGFTVLSAKDFPNFPEVEERGDSIEANAILKATEVQRATGLPALADDTGLEVEALDGAPGVYSSRYAGGNASYAENITKLLRDMRNIPGENRGARFRCVMALADGKHVLTAEGRCDGEILRASKGHGGFGYDPVFFVPAQNQTFAEMTKEVKNRISHRGKALERIRPMIVQLFEVAAD